MHRCHLLFLASILCLPASALAAQSETKRVRMGGYVLDRTGKPWIGAQVHLVSRLVPGNEWIGEVDTIEVTSGKRGRFVAQVRPGWDYLVWAVSTPIDGQYRSTHPRLGVRSGPFRLHERTGRLVQVQVRVVGDPAWHWPLSAKVTGAPAQLGLGQARVGDPYEVFPITFDEQGGAQIPQLPWKEVTVEIYDNRGVQLWAPIVKLIASDRKKALEATPAAKPPANEMLETVKSLKKSELRLPIPKLRKLLVNNSKGKPLEGVELCQRIRGHLVAIAKSDAKGIVTTQVPLRYADHWDRIFQLRGDSRLVVRKDGYSEQSAEKVTTSGLRGALLLGGAKNAGLKLQKADTESGRLLLGPDKPWAGAKLILLVRGVSQVQVPVLLTTDDLGRFSFSQIPKTPWVLLAVLDDEVRGQLASRSEFPLGRLAILASNSGSKLASQPDLDLTKLRLTELQLERFDGGPASDAHVDLFRHTGFNAIPPLVQLRADRRGRLALLVGECGNMLLLAQDDYGYAPTDLKACTGRVHLELGRTIHLSGILKDRAGNPAAGARIMIDSSILHRFNPKPLRNGMIRLNFGFHLAHRFNRRADAQGRFRIWAPPEAESLPIFLTPAGSRARKNTTLLLDGISKRGIQLVVD